MGSNPVAGTIFFFSWNLGSKYMYENLSVVLINCELYELSWMKMWIRYS